MRDLNATMFYKAKFTVRTEKAEDDLLWKLVLNIRHWITRKLNRDGHRIVEEDRKKWSHFKNGCKLYDQEGHNAFFAESCLHLTSGQVCWACMIAEKPQPESGYAQREWTTEIGYRSLQPGTAELSYVITYRDAGGFIGPCLPEPDISVPRVIRNLLSDPTLVCSLGGQRLTLQPRCLQPGDYPALAAVLFAPERQVPVIYLSPRPNEEGGRPSLPPEAVAEAVAANALVYYADDPEFTQEMRSIGPADHSCGSGAVRIYLPHLEDEKSAAAHRHRYITAREIGELGAENVLKMLRRALAQDVHFYESLFRLRNCKALIEADKHKEKIAEAEQRLVEMRQQHDVDCLRSEIVANEALEAFLDESKKRLEAEELAQDYMDQCEELERDKHSLKTTLEAYRSQIERISLLEEANQQVRGISAFPNTPLKVAQYFAAVYPERIVFTERGYRSLEDCTTKCEMLWEIFYHIVHELYDLLQQNPAMAYKEFKQRTGWHCSSGEGPMTRKDAKLMRGYEDEYLGQEIDIEAHIKNGVKESDPNFVRIHFDYKPQLCPQIIIGHCGRHIDNFTTKKIK